MLNELIGAVIQVVIFALIPVIIWFITARKKETFFYWIGFRRPAQGKWLKTVFITYNVTRAFWSVYGMDE